MIHGSLHYNSMFRIVLCAIAYNLVYKCVITVDSATRYYFLFVNYICFQKYFFFSKNYTRTVFSLKEWITVSTPLLGCEIHMLPVVRFKN